MATQLDYEIQRHIDKGRLVEQCNYHALQTIKFFSWYSMANCDEHTIVIWKFKSWLNKPSQS